MPSGGGSRCSRDQNRLAPKATEGIHYGMAGYKYKGKPVIYLARWRTTLRCMGGSSSNIWMGGVRCHGRGT